MQHQFLMYRYTSHLHTCSRIVQGSDSMTQFPPWRAGHLMMRPYVDPLMNLLEGDSSWIHGTTGRDIKKTTRVKKSQKSANKKRLRWVYIYKWVIKETYNIRNNIYIYMILLSIILISDLQRTGCFISQLVQDFVPWTTFLFSQSKWLQKSRSGLGKLMLFPFPVINGALFHGNLRDHPDFINSRPFPWSVRILKFDSRC